ncbi:MAG: FAD-dependent pyridine nucleotide-disulfide oxidoreductase, partial [Clostridiales bacterium]|nr:FAD-dependent pyridine nucleotide-disulfide oxidoreductase [Clostridiales bacterium]
MLHSAGIQIVQKPFSIGVRIEHPQHLINQAQYGESASHPRLGAADYQLFYKKPDRTVYSFCMCPGGIVVASASEHGMVVTNGMSEFARDKANANSALVVSVEPGDFGSSHPLAGVEFQRRWERLAFKAGGGNNSAPVQRLEDFIEGRVGAIGSIKPSYTGSVNTADINLCLPHFVTEPMKESLAYFDKKLKGFAMKDALLTGVETRTSSPIRLPRGETLEAVGINGLYPSGEGAGYAGGIVSAAVDGIRVAEQIIKTYNI